MLNFLALGAASGFVGVALGAFGAHALKDRFDAYATGIWQTAVQYQMWHALGLLLVGVLLRLSGVSAGPARVAGWAFLLGTVFFSGSLYILALTGVRAWGAVTPIGGLAFLVGWLALARLALRL